jgi:aminotransferase
MGKSLIRMVKIVVTCGSTEAMMAAMMSDNKPGDKVLCFLRFTKIWGRYNSLQEQSLYMFPYSPAV